MPEQTEAGRLIVGKWFAAHVVMYVKLKDQPQDRFTVWENIVLIKACSEDEAFEKARFEDRKRRATRTGLSAGTVSPPVGCSGGCAN